MSLIFVEVDVRLFLDGGQRNTNQPQLTPIILGAFPYECVGNVNFCQNGFTISLWYNSDPGDSKLPHYYVFSSGGQSALSEGVYIRQNLGEEYEVGVANGPRLWQVTFSLITGSWTNIALTWSTSDGLVVYVDAIRVEQDFAGSERVFWMGEFDPFQNLSIGKANDEEADVQDGHMRIWNLIHADVKYEPDQIGRFICKFDLNRRVFKICCIQK